MPDPLDLGERVIAILQQGQKLSTYKLATLWALVDYCLANVPNDPKAPLDVPIEALADGVMRLYWQQVLEFPTTAKRLQQSSQEDKKPLAILTQVERLRAVVDGGQPGISFGSAQVKAEKQYKRARSAVATTLRRYPLALLQRLPSGGGHASQQFLYDDRWMNGSKEDVAAHHGMVRLKPGVATALARLSGLLIPTINVLWVEKVQDLNRAVSENVPDFEGYLFGRDRTALKRVGDALKKAYGVKCFYCHKRIATEVDHVLPWSRSHIDSLANLVQGCRPCNTNKSGLLPVPKHVKAALERED
ncbi:HNH endonuclease, partial [Mycobacterium sp. 852002-51152_SCH6134967]|uniref:HNH endonuclease n=1 Tax=Mycobacterium sp. 852002-51152_SCH6134967 TaxID=1834096 RepID=UPI0018D57D9E